MRSSSSIVAAMAVLMVVMLQFEGIISTKPPTTYIVGDEEGWDLVIDMESWTRGKDFYAGDILVFKYDSERFDVVVVDQQGHDSCTVGPNSKTFDSGNDRIRLNFGANYFIDSVPDICAAGMKMAINATAPPPSP